MDCHLSPSISQVDYSTSSLIPYSRLRLTPMYVFVMLMNVTLFTFVSNGPFWRPIEPEGCKYGRVIDDQDELLIADTLGGLICFISTTS